MISLILLVGLTTMLAVCMHAADEFITHLEWRADVACVVAEVEREAAERRLRLVMAEEISEVLEHSRPWPTFGDKPAPRLVRAVRDGKTPAAAIVDDDDPGGRAA